MTQGFTVGRHGWEAKADAELPRAGSPDFDMLKPSVLSAMFPVCTYWY